MLSNDTSFEFDVDQDLFPGKDQDDPGPETKQDSAEIDAIIEDIKALLDARKQAICEKNGVITHHDQRRLHRYFEKAMKHLLFELWAPIPRKPKFGSLKWLHENKDIAPVLQRAPKLVPILDAIEQSTLRADDPESIRLNDIKKLSFGPKGYKLALFIADSTFYDELSEKVGLSKDSIQGYIAELIRIGIIKDHGGTPGRKGRVRLMSIGYWTAYRKDSFRKILYCKKSNKEMIAKLSTFKTFKGSLFLGMHPEK